MKLAKKLLIAALVILIGMQFYRPPKNEADLSEYVAFFENETAPSEEVKVILKSACYDCHSANTQYPWYNNVAPISYWMYQHIEEGKEHLDFSEWESYSLKKKDHKLEEVIEEVEEGKMPLMEYTWTHKNARLTNEQVEALMEWAKKARASYEVAHRQD